MLNASVIERDQETTQHDPVHAAPSLLDHENLLVYELVHESRLPQFR